MKELTSFSHGYGQLMGHIVLVPYRRKKIFKRDDIKFCAENIFKAISRKYEFEIIEMRILEDHVHFFLSMKPSHNVSTVIQCLKGISAKHLREMYPELKAYSSKHLWSAGKFFRSVGAVTADTVEYYIKESQGKQKEQEVAKIRKKSQNPQKTLGQFIS
jgi:putative transposase